MTVLKCSDWGCARTTVETFLDQRNYEDKEADRPGKATLSNILCRIHAGAQKRSKYRNDPLPLSDKDRQRLLKEQAVIDQEDAEAMKVARAEEEARAARENAKDWEYQNSKTYYLIQEEAPGYSPQEEPEPTFTGHIYDEGQSPTEGGWDSSWFRIEPTRRFYGVKAKRLYPYEIRLTRMASLSPNEARTLAYALQEAAAKAELLNKSRKPSGT